MDDGYRYDTVTGRFAPEIRDADTVAEVFAAAAALWPDRSFVTDATTDETLTFGEFHDRARALAGALASVGVESDDRVGLYLHNGLAYPVAIAACAMLGAVQTPINWHYKAREAAHAFDTAEVGTVLVEPDNEFLDVLDETAGDSPVSAVVVLDGMEGTYRNVEGVTTHRRSGLSGEVPEVPRDKTDPVAILYTSGTTGLPKPAVLSNESFLLAATSFRAIPFEEGDVNYNPFPLFHANAQCYSLLGSALVGGHYVLADRFSASAFLEHVAAHDVTSVNILGGVPKMLLAAYEDREVPENGLDIAAGPISTEAWEPFEERFGLTVAQLYSQTEHPVLLVNHPERAQIRHGAMGKPTFPDLGHEVRILDEDGDEVPAGEQGELVRTAVGAMDGYRGMPEKTEETLRDGWIHSGDIVRADEDGFLYYVDRKKFMIRRAGENIAAREVEDVIDELPGVAASAVIPVPDDVRGEEVKALVQRQPGAEVSERDIVAHVAATLAAYKVPRYVAFVDSFPRTPSERIQRVTLAEEHAEREHAWDREHDGGD
ncbi:class I adenylate-forming enzyme family protein [Natronomonas sp. EA1]|uniref:class I adenylate-forming enzyme family protein n=1 Tax=Natronomonas sp. EA1 TaxID=3421655 RepID=UPI003EBF2C9E